MARRGPSLRGAAVDHRGSKTAGPKNKPSRYTLRSGVPMGRFTLSQIVAR